MFNRKSKLTVWILSAAITLSAFPAATAAADVLPSIGAGSSIIVTDTETVANTDIVTTDIQMPAKQVKKAQTVLPGAGVETAAGGIASTVIVTDEIAVVETAAAADTTAQAVEVSAPTLTAGAVAEPVLLAAYTPADTTPGDTAVVQVPSTVSGQDIPDVADTEEQAVAVESAEVAGESLAGVVPSDVAEKITSGADAAANSAREMYSNLVIAKCNDYVNVRKEPNEDAEILGKLYNESVGDYVSEAEGGWYEIISGTVRGYVKAEYVVTGDAAVQRAKEVGKRLATVNTETLYVRESATTDSPVIGMVAGGDDLTVVEEADEGWAKVSVEEGEGYISKDYVTLKTEFVKAESKEEEAARLAKEKAEREAALAAARKKSGKKSKGSSSGGGSYAAPSGGGGSAVANYALQFVGNPYVYGGSSLTNGTDCSGFTMSVYAAFGVGLPHSSGAQRSCGTDVGGLANAQPGDLVCYSGHVGIYIGGGQIVHASTAKTGIKVSNASYRSVLSVRRIF